MLKYGQLKGKYVPAICFYIILQSLITFSAYIPTTNVYAWILLSI